MTDGQWSIPSQLWALNFLNPKLLWETLGAIQICALFFCFIKEWLERMSCIISTWVELCTDNYGKWTKGYCSKVKYTVSQWSTGLGIPYDCFLSLNNCLSYLICHLMMFKTLRLDERKLTVTSLFHTKSQLWLRHPKWENVTWLWLGVYVYVVSLHAHASCAADLPEAAWSS